MIEKEKLHGRGDLEGLNHSTISMLYKCYCEECENNVFL